jgi:L-proline amide hydrolase
MVLPSSLSLGEYISRFISGRTARVLTVPLRTRSLKDWTITARLPLITLPTLIVSGRYDEAAPSCQATLKQGIVGSEQVIFEESSHCPFVEEREKYMQVVGDFLKKHD